MKKLRLNKKNVYYLASPYSHKDKFVQESRYIETLRWGSELTKAGYFLIEPIAMSHAVSKIADLPTGYEFWKTRDRGCNR